MSSEAEKIVAELAASGKKRDDLIPALARALEAHTMLEIGVWKGALAARMLAGCPRVETYWMLDPWRPMARWNKPFNVAQETFDLVREEALAATDFAGARRRILQGTTLEVIDEIADASLDLVYVDGDHTLRGITIDLILAWRKLRPGGVLAGDDFYPGIWQHGPSFEPTMIFPFAVHFAEAQRVRFHTLGDRQYAMVKPAGDAPGFALCDHTPGNRFDDPSLLRLVRQMPASES